MEWGLTWLGIASLLATGAVAALVYFRQNRDHARWAKPDSEWKTELKSMVETLEGAVGDVDTGVEELNSAIRELSEKLAQADEREVAADAEPVPGEPIDADATAPANVDEYTKELKARGIQLDYSKLRWSKKVRADGDGRGNLGWFVDSGGGKRYFIHRGRKTLIRPAIPRDLLAEWEKATGKHPREVELDYQTGRGKGNHAWYVRTYGGNTWRIGTGKGAAAVTPLTD